MRGIAGIGVVVLAGVACRAQAQPGVVRPTAAPLRTEPALEPGSRTGVELRCEPATTGPDRVVCDCDEVAASIRPLCTAMLDALRTGDSTRLAAHARAGVGVRGCVDRTCEHTRYRDATEVGEAVAVAGGFHDLLGLTGTHFRLVIHSCPSCRNNQLLSVCVSPVDPAHRVAPPGEDDAACLSGEGALLRAIALRRNPVDVDADGDDISIGRDRCPEEAETWNGREDADGCPEDSAARIRIDRGEDVIMIAHPIEFEGDRATLSPGAVATLDEVAAYLRAWPDRALRIHLHIEADPHPHAAVPLAHQRAEAIYDLLVARGVDPARLQAVPITDDTTGPPPTGSIAQTVTLALDVGGR